MYAFADECVHSPKSGLPESVTLVGSLVISTLEISSRISPSRSARQACSREMLDWRRLLSVLKST